jgi:threonine dehydrogenase-like Zn-dependent dehydrogenase
MSFNMDGSWATGTVVPARHVHKLPRNLGFPEGAIMNCSVFTAYHANKLAGTTAGRSVLVYGLGGVGISVLEWASIFGANEIIAVDNEEGKLQLARQKGATHTINAKEVSDPVKEIKSITNGGVDIGFEVIGKVDTTRRTLESVRKGGKACMVGMCFDNWPINTVNDLQVPEVQVMSPQDHLKSEIPEVLKFIESGRYEFKNVVTHRIPLEEVNQGIEILDKRIGNPGRIVLEPEQN